MKISRSSLGRNACVLLVGAEKVTRNSQLQSRRAENNEAILVKAGRTGSEITNNSKRHPFRST